VPPDQVDVNETDCPLSIVGFRGKIVGVPSAEFTVSVDEDEGYTSPVPWDWSPITAVTV
jgi:hypothetical protein